MAFSGTVALVLMRLYVRQSLNKAFTLNEVTVLMNSPGLNSQMQHTPLRDACVV